MQRLIVKPGSERTLSRHRYYVSITNAHGGEISPGSTALGQMARHLTGKIFADNGYIGKELFKPLWQRDLQLITCIRREMKTYTNRR